MSKLGDIIKYWPVLGELFDFLKKLDEAVDDGKITDAERSVLFKEFWDIVRAAKVARAK